MSIQTNYLKLIKPIAGSENWGNALNQNLDKIDLSYAKLNNTIQGMSSRLNEMGMFNFLQYVDSATTREIDYIQFRSGIAQAGDTYYKITGVPERSGSTFIYPVIALGQKPDNLYDTSLGSVALGNLITNGDDIYFNEDRSSEYGRIYYNDYNSSHAQLAELPDYTAFYIDSPYIIVNGTVTAVSIYAFGKQWTGGEILIKSSALINNAIVPNFSKLKQTLGGYYQPVVNSNHPNNITFTKTATANAAATVDLYIPHNVYNAVENVVNLNDEAYVVFRQNEYCHNTGQYYSKTVQETDAKGESVEVTYYFTINDVKFFTMRNNVRYYFSVEYSMYRDTFDQWNIIVDGTYLKDVVGVSGQPEYYMSYNVASSTQVTN